MKHIKILQNIGLKKQEAEIYLACLKLGMAKASDLSNETSIIRTSVYGHIKSLIEKGYLKKSKKRGVEYFSPLNPKEILDEKKEQLEKFSSIVPNLENLIGIFGKKPKIEYFDTKQGQIHLFEKILKISPKNPLIFIESGKSLKYLGDKMGINFWFNWQKRFLEKKISAQGISTLDYIPHLKSLPDNFKRVFIKRPVIVRIVDEKEFPFLANVYLIYPNLVFIQVPQENFAISIENKNIYDLFMIFYRLLFEKGRVFDLRNI